MSRAAKVRLLHLLAYAAERRSPTNSLIMWCFHPRDMPAEIDRLIARGELTEADRPHCIHWTATFPRLPSDDNRGGDAGAATPAGREMPA